MTGRIVFLTAGDQRQLTGGNLYNRRVLQALRASPRLADHVVDQIAVPRGDEEFAPPGERRWDVTAWLRDEIVSRHPALLVVDSIALAPAARVAAWLRTAHGVKILALMHMLPSALAEAERANVQAVAVERGVNERSILGDYPSPVNLSDSEGSAAMTNYRRDSGRSFAIAQVDSLTALRELENGFLREADRIVAVSPALRDMLIAAGAPANRVAVVLPGWDGHGIAQLSAGNGIGPTDAQPRPETPQRGVSTGRDASLRRLRFLCVANWSPAKGIYRLVRALALVRAAGVRAELDLVGDEGEPVYAADVRASIERYDLADHVHHYGSVAPAIVSSFYRAADVFVLPSRSEGFGTVFAEAMSYGLPIIAEAIGPLPWLVGSNRGVLVPPGDDGTLAEAMRALAVDPSRRRALGRAGHAFARRLPTWSESGARFVEIVGELL